MKTIVYAASDITFIEIDAARFWNPPATFTQGGKVYRRLTPEYWAWFYRKYHVVEKALVNGKISETAFVEILDRFSALYNHAVAAYGKETLREAVRLTDISHIDEAVKRDNAVGNVEPSVVRESRRRAPSIVAERGR
ncbi:MAG TPA: hypothetical protein PLK80_05840 [bacterium]|nr:MAG: hypothetical protein BWY28_03234 [bacterium ADurb.Bin236]HOY63553.1 hypothetical protein [bacterium]HPI76237.1 hypothetical protein [bacterium]